MTRDREPERDMVEVTVTDLITGDMVALPGRWEGTRPVASVSGDSVLTGTVEMGWRWDEASAWMRDRPYTDAEVRWFAPFID